MDAVKKGSSKISGFLTLNDVAEALHVKPRTVRDWTARRKIAFTRFGRRLLFPSGEIESRLRANTVTPGPTRRAQGGAKPEDKIDE